MYNSNEAQDIRDLATQVHDCWRNIYTIKIIPKGSHFFIILVIIFLIVSEIIWYVFFIWFYVLLLCGIFVNNWICAHFFFVCLLWRPQMMSWVLVEPRTVVPKGWWKMAEQLEKLLELIQMKQKFEEFLWLKYEQQRDRYIDRYKYTVDRLMVGWIDG